MRYPNIILFILLFLTTGSHLFAQCRGTLGDPIVNINFGSGVSTFRKALGGDTTNYAYTSGTPNDGQYTIARTTYGLNPGWNQNIVNHTANDPNGYMMVVNASNSPGIFFQSNVTGLCPNTTYEFSAWIINILRSTGIKPKVSFTIESNGRQLLQFSTNDILENTGWIKYASTFTTDASASNITLKMVNDNPGGLGNDLAIDDITFSACGPLITPSIENNNTTNASICEGEAARFNFKSDITPGVYLNPKFQWQLNNGRGYVNLDGATTNSLTIAFINPTAGTYQYRLLAADGDNINSTNCRIAGQPLTITVNAKPQAIAETIAPVCIGNSIQLKASGGTTYQWTGPNQFSSNEQNPVIPNATKLMAGTYNVQVMLNSCVSATATTVQILDPIEVNTNIQSTTICASSSTQLEASGGTTYLWQPAKGLSNPNIFNPIATPSETTTYTVTVSNGGCSETADITVNVNQNTSANAGEDHKIIVGQSVELKGIATGDGISYFWTPTDYLDDPTKLNPIASPVEDITYTLHVNTSTGCGSSSDEVFIKVYPKIVIPNTFTPNGDNINDTWNIPAATAFPNPKLKIINRSGQMVYESTGTFKPWDGKFNGKDVPPAPYYYTIYFNEEFKTYSGWIMLIR